jgi:hypothetical protein
MYYFKDKKSSKEAKLLKQILDQPKQAATEIHFYQGK